MYSDDDLNAAVAAGTLSPEAAAGLRDFVARQRATPAVDEEHFRLLTGFNDIFVAIAATLILVAMGWLGGGHGVGGIAVAMTSWALAEYFTRHRRMALPSIILLIGFIAGSSIAGLALMGPTGRFLENADLLSDHKGVLVALPAACGVIGAGLHWWRFKVPITVAAGALALVGLILSLSLALKPSLLLEARPVLLVCGLAVFGLAMWWDMSDRARVTRRADVAFWLHLSAAPLIVHPIFGMLGLLGRGNTDTGRAGAAVAIYLVLALVALIIDRRALLVSALIYVLYAISTLLRAAGSLSASFALTALIIGSALLLLSAFWHRARRTVVEPLPASVKARLPVI
jgi:MFS family permease